MCPVSTGQRAGNRAASVPPGAPLDLEVPHVGAERRDLEERDESCPVNTGEGTSRVCLVRGEGRGVSAGYEERPGGRGPWGAGVAGHVGGWRAAADLGAAGALSGRELARVQAPFLPLLLRCAPDRCTCEQSLLAPPPPLRPRPLPRKC